MRSELVFAAKAHVHNRYLLTKLVAKASRKMHRPMTHIPNTINYVLWRLSRGPRGFASSSTRVAAASKREA